MTAAVSRADAFGIPATERLIRSVTRLADRTPDAAAVIAPDGEFSYRELHRQTQAIMAELRGLGVTLATPVGLGTGRSRQTVAGLLAVWWLGGNAVLLDDRHPADRITHALTDAGAAVLVADRAPAGLPASVPLFRPAAPTAGGPAPANPAAVDSAAGDPVPAVARVHPAEVAYVIYTSGTTGVPKGVQVTHDGLDTFLQALAGLNLPAGGTSINAVSPAFDGWLWCTLLSLVHDQTVALLDLSVTAAAGPMSVEPAAAIAALRPRTVSLTPSLLAACQHDLPSAEVLVVAGEPCPPGLIQRYLPGRRVLNVYGPTETTIAATWADSARDDDLATIGRPLPGYRAYVLDAQRRPVPDGTAGELYIGGSALARGYCNQPGLTAARFVPDPAGGPGARMYRTGDEVLRRPDGQLVYLGRADDQVKLRGFRVELGEIERVAAQEPGVAAAVAVVLPGDRVGLAVVPAAEPATAPGAAPAAAPVASPADGGHAPEPLPQRVRARCLRNLPEYMLPATVVLVEAVPVASTGKVDREAVAALLREAGTGHRQASPRRSLTAREQEVSDAWGGLLGGPVTDLDRSFFDLGGHSLLAAQAVAQLRRQTGLPVSVRLLLEHPTVAGFARQLDRLAGTQPESGT